MKRSAWIGRAARARIRRNGPRAKARQAASVTQWKTIRAAVLARAGGGRLDVHHLIKRAQGGSDFDLDQLVAVCRRYHEQTDAPYARGRLLVVGLGGWTISLSGCRERLHPALTSYADRGYG